MAELVDQHRADRAQLAGIARLAQDPGRGIAAPVAEHREVDLHQREAIEEGQQHPRIVTRLDADGGGVGLVAAGIHRHGGVIHRLVVAEAELHLVGGLAQIIAHKAPP